MPQYRVLEKSFIDNNIVEEGAVIEYAGEASNNLELVEEPKAKAKKDAAPAADSLV